MSRGGKHEWTIKLGKRLPVSLLLINFNPTETAEIITHSGAAEFTAVNEIGRSNKKLRLSYAKIRFGEMAAISFDSVFLQFSCRGLLIYVELELNSYKTIHIANRPDFATKLTFPPSHSPRRRNALRKAKGKVAPCGSKVKITNSCLFLGALQCEAEKKPN